VFGQRAGQRKVDNSDGVIELGIIVDMIAEAALDALLAALDRSRHSLWLDRSQHLEARGGSWSHDGKALLWVDPGVSICSKLSDFSTRHFHLFDVVGTTRGGS